MDSYVGSPAGVNPCSGDLLKKGALSDHGVVGEPRPGPALYGIPMSCLESPSLCGRCCHLNIGATARAQASTTAGRETGVMTSMTHLGPRGHA